MTTATDHPTVVPRQHFRSIIRGKHEDCVVLDPQLVDRVEEFTDICINLHQHITPVAVAALSCELRAWHNRHMRLGVRQIDKERLIRPCLPLHKFNRPVR